MYKYIESGLGCLGNGSPWQPCFAPWPCNVTSFSVVLSLRKIAWWLRWWWCHRPHLPFPAGPCDCPALMLSVMPLCALHIHVYTCMVYYWWLMILFWKIPIWGEPTFSMLHNKALTGWMTFSSGYSSVVTTLLIWFLHLSTVRIVLYMCVVVDQWHCGRIIWQRTLWVNLSTKHEHSLILPKHTHSNTPPGMHLLQCHKLNGSHFPTHTHTLFAPSLLAK